MSTTPPRETAPTPQDPHAEQISKQTPTTTFLVKTDDDPPHSHSHPQSHVLPMNSLRSPPTEQDTCSPNGKITVGAAEAYPPGGPDCQGSHSPGKPCCGLGGPRIGEAMMSTSEAKLAEPIPGAGEESTYLEKTSDELDLQPEGRTQHLQTDGQQNPSSSPVMPDTPTPIYEFKGAPAPAHREEGVQHHSTTSDSDSSSDSVPTTGTHPHASTRAHHTRKTRGHHRKTYRSILGKRKRVGTQGATPLSTQVITISKKRREDHASLAWTTTSSTPPVPPDRGAGAHGHRDILQSGDIEENPGPPHKMNRRNLLTPTPTAATPSASALEPRASVANEPLSRTRDWRAVDDRVIQQGSARRGFSPAPTPRWDPPAMSPVWGATHVRNRITKSTMKPQPIRPDTAGDFENIRHE